MTSDFIRLEGARYGFRVGLEHSQKVVLGIKHIVAPSRVCADVEQTEPPAHSRLI